MPDIEVQVLIVGGSLVGLSTALFLADHGVRSLTVEHHPGTAIYPRAAQIYQRTMEIFRAVGIEQLALEKSEEQFVQDGAVMAVDTLAGKELAWYVPNLNEGVRDVSPSVRVFLTQKLLEPLLKQRAEQSGAELRFGTDMVSFEQDAGGVTAIIKDGKSGRPSTVRAQYMVAADGSHSRVREQLGIRLLGHGLLSNSITIYFRGRVGHLLRGRNLSVIYVYNDELTGFFRIEKPFDSGFLAVNSLGNPDRPNMDVWTGLTEERCRDLVRIALGVDDVPVTIENVMKWQATADWAERFHDGRVFLAGDAAHAMPPTGGFGGNAGVQDAHNLAWKLALVLNGVAGAELLATYDEERRPVGAFTVEQAYSRYVTRWARHLGTEGIQPIANDLDVDLGYRYRSAALIADGPDDGLIVEPARETKGRPGTRAPHLVINHEGKTRSTLDWFGRHFVMLAGPEGGAWLQHGPDAARAAGIKLDVHRLGDPSFAAAYGITATGAVLVRPDGFVGWRAQTDTEASGSVVSRVLSAILAQRSVAAPQ
ncbi:MAG TPA: FAD-dependent monooxygenase [Bryobacteraceae bacterium]|nr:FAD-dependent monooxygenase [Bryobacteraceae bacterium]